MKSVTKPTLLFRLRSKEPPASKEVIKEVVCPTVAEFPLQSASKDHLVFKETDDGSHNPSQDHNEDYTVYLKLLEYASSSSISLPTEIYDISPVILNKLDASEGAAPLHYASINGNLCVVKSLLAQGADVNIWDAKKQMTPFICAAAHGQLEIVKVILELDCDVNAGLNDSSQGSALLWAVRRNQTEVIRYLLAHDASQIPNLPYSETPIHAAVMSGSLETLEILINAQQSSHVNKTDFQMGLEKNTPLHLAASGKYPNSLEICKILLEQGSAQIGSLNAKDQTPLHVAVASQNADIVNLLLCCEANVNAADKDGRSPLFYGIGDSQESMKCVKLLIDSGKCDINHQDKKGYTALHFAAAHLATTLVDMLLMNNADFSIKAHGGISALNIMRRKLPDRIPHLARVFDQAVTLTLTTPDALNMGEAQQDCKLEVDFKYVLPSSPRVSSPVQEVQPEGDKNFRRLSRITSIFISNEEDQITCSLSRRKETAKIKCLIEEGQSSLLLHPVIHSFLQLKWHNARPIFLPSLLTKIALVLLFSAYVQIPYVKIASATCSQKIHQNCTSEALQSETKSAVPLWSSVMYRVIVVMATFKGVTQFIKILRAPRTQLKTWHPWITAAVLMVMIFYMKPQDWAHTEKNSLRRSMAALAVLLTWIDLWLDMSRFPNIGLSIRVFLRVFKNFSSFILPHICLLAGFVLSFTVLLPDNEEFKSVLMGLTKIIRVMAGDITMPNGTVRNLTPYDEDNAKVAAVLLVYIYTAFVLMVAIVLMNLLVGLAVNDIQGIYADAAMDKLVKQTILLNTMETSFNEKWMRTKPVREFFSKYINLYSKQKTVTLMTNDYRDRTLGADLKRALLDIGTDNRIRMESQGLASSSSSCSLNVMHHYRQNAVRGVWTP